MSAASAEALRPRVRTSGGRRLLGGVVLRVLLSPVLGVGIVAAAAGASLLTAAPAWVSLALEPLSLLLLPGFALSMLFTDAHEFTLTGILVGCCGFYSVLAWVALEWRFGRVNRRRGSR